MDDAVDEGDGAGGAREDLRPVAEGEIGGEDQGFALVSHRDDAEEQVGVSVIVAEVSDLIDAQKRESGVVLEPSLEGAKELRGITRTSAVLTPRISLARSPS